MDPPERDGQGEERDELSNALAQCAIDGIMVTVAQEVLRQLPKGCTPAQPTWDRSATALQRAALLQAELRQGHSHERCAIIVTPPAVDRTPTAICCKAYGVLSISAYRAEGKCIIVPGPDAEDPAAGARMVTKEQFLKVGGARPNSHWQRALHVLQVDAEGTLRAHCALVWLPTHGYPIDTTFKRSATRALASEPKRQRSPAAAAAIGGKQRGAASGSPALTAPTTAYARQGSKMQGDKGQHRLGLSSANRPTSGNASNAAGHSSAHLQQHAPALPQVQPAAPCAPPWADTQPTPSGQQQQQQQQQQLQQKQQQQQHASQLQPFLQPPLWGPMLGAQGSHLVAGSSPVGSAQHDHAAAPSGHRLGVEASHGASCSEQAPLGMAEGGLARLCATPQSRQSPASATTTPLGGPDGTAPPVQSGSSAESTPCAQMPGPASPAVAALWPVAGGPQVPGACPPHGAPSHVSQQYTAPAQVNGPSADPRRSPVQQAGAHGAGQAPSSAGLAGQPMQAGATSELQALPHTVPSQGSSQGSQVAGSQPLALPPVPPTHPHVLQQQWHTATEYAYVRASSPALQHQAAAALSPTLPSDPLPTAVGGMSRANSASGSQALPPPGPHWGALGAPSAAEAQPYGAAGAQPHFAQPSALGPGRSVQQPFPRASYGLASGAVHACPPRALRQHDVSAMGPGPEDIPCTPPAHPPAPQPHRAADPLYLNKLQLLQRLDEHERQRQELQAQRQQLLQQHLRLQRDRLQLQEELWRMGGQGMARRGSAAVRAAPLAAAPGAPAGHGGAPPMPTALQQAPAWPSQQRGAPFGAPQVLPAGWPPYSPGADRMPAECLAAGAGMHWPPAAAPPAGAAARQPPPAAAAWQQPYPGGSWAQQQAPADLGQAQLLAPAAGGAAPGAAYLGGPPPAGQGLDASQLLMRTASIPASWMGGVGGDDDDAELEFLLSGEPLM